MSSAAGKIFHPATLQLLRFQASAKLKKLLASFKNPRRQILSILAICLGLLWVSQALLSVLFRQAADPTQLRMWLPLGLMLYSVYHAVKTVTRSATAPFDWTSAEQEYVLAAPLARRQIITYRLISIFNAALAKAICFSIVMIPDVTYWLLGFIGILAGLLFVDLVRVSFELVFHGLSRIEQIITRTIVLTVVGGACLWAITNSFIIPTLASDADAAVGSTGALALAQSLLREIAGLYHSLIGKILTGPYQIFTTIVLSQVFDGKIILLTISGLALVGGLLASVYGIDDWMLKRRRSMEQISLQTMFSRRSSDRDMIQRDRLRKPVRVPRRWFGVGSLAWRQGWGVVNYKAAIVFSLAVPIFLSCLPLLANHNSIGMLLHVVASMVFYSFLLLPPALMLDFRRDIKRMTVLKALPLSPWAITIGQLAIPVTVCTAFQAIVLAIATIHGSVIGWHAAIALVLLLPVNVLIFAVENYIFLLAPYHKNKEGFDVFLRTILTFTGKGVLFAVGLGVLAIWAMMIKAMVNRTGMEPIIGGVIFGCGVWLMTLSLAALFVIGIKKLFVRFDPSMDAPGAG